MGTHNGELYILDQLDSLARQTHVNWTLQVSDDHSTDSTIEKISNWALKTGFSVTIRSNLGRGFVDNFLSLVCDTSIQGDLFLLCDQDDIWHPEKIQRILAAVDCQAGAPPTLYGGRTTYIDQTGSIIGTSRIMKRRPSLSNALVQCIAGGNTMAFNQSLKHQIEDIGFVLPASHDWWIYLVATIVPNSRIIFDDSSLVLYRQHQRSLVGENRSLRSKLSRLKSFFSGKFFADLRLHSSLLKSTPLVLGHKDRLTLNQFDVAIRDGGVRSAVIIWKLRVLRNSMLENFVFYATIIFRGPGLYLGKRHAKKNIDLNR